MILASAVHRGERMNDEHDPPRSEESDLVEITSRLGEPESIHRTNQGSVVWRLVLGALIVLGAAATHYFLWTGQVGWLKGAKPWIIALAVMFVAPGVGIYLIAFAIRGMKLAALVYPTGLFVRHRGRVVAFPWNDVKVIQISGLPQKAVLQCQQPPDVEHTTVWFDLSRSRRRTLGTTITITREDGEQATLASTLDGFAELGQRIQEETFRRLFPRSLVELSYGTILTFGPLWCDRNRLVFGKQEVLWSELESLDRVADLLHLKRVGKKKVFAKCAVSDVVNLHVLMGLAASSRSIAAMSE